MHVWLGGVATCFLAVTGPSAVSTRAPQPTLRVWVVLTPSARAQLRVAQVGQGDGEPLSSAPFTAVSLPWELLDPGLSSMLPLREASNPSHGPCKPTRPPALTFTAGVKGVSNFHQHGER